MMRRCRLGLPVIPDTYPRARKAARPPSSRLRRAEPRLSHDRVPHARRDEDRIARADHSTFAVEFYLARAFKDEIKLLQNLVIMPLCPASCGDARFRKALVLNGRIRAIENRTDSRAVFRDKR